MRLTFVVLLACGCASLGRMETASTLGKGNVVGGVETTGYLDYYFDPAVPAQTGLTNPIIYPQVNGFVRFGLTDRFDLGLRGGSTLLEIETKVMFTDPDSALLALSLAPSLMGFYLPSVTSAGQTTPAIGLIGIPIPLLIGLKLGGHELVFGPRVVNQIVFYNDGRQSGGYVLSVGTSVGFAARITQSFVLMPEISMLMPVFVSAATPFGTASVAGVGSIAFSAGLSCTFGKMKPRPGDATPPPAPEEAPAPLVPPPPPPPLLPSDVAQPPPPPPPQPAPQT
jgi:hypothetical protein